MADYDPEWGARMQRKYGATEADLSSAEGRQGLNRRAARDRANAGQPAATPAPAQAPPMSTPETLPPGQVDPNGPGSLRGGGGCADGSLPRMTMCAVPPCPSVCADGSTPSGGTTGTKPPPGSPGYPGPGGGYPGPGGGYPPPYPGFPPSGWGQGYYGGPGTTQRAGFPGSAGYPTPGRPTPLYPGQGGGAAGPYGGWNPAANYPNMNYPPPNMAYNAMMTYDPNRRY